MNCRPLGKHRSDEEDIQPLRPLDLIMGYMEANDDPLPTWDTEPKDKLKRGHMYTCRLSQEWWERWLRRYPLQLQQRQKWTRAERNIQKGDFVLVIDASTPPVGRYPFAVVVDTKLCNDGKMRSVTVRMRDGRVREREVRKIVLLEASGDYQSTSMTDSNSDGDIHAADEANNSTRDDGNIHAADEANNSTRDDGDIYADDFSRDDGDIYAADFNRDDDGGFND